MEVVDRYESETHLLLLQYIEALLEAVEGGGGGGLQQQHLLVKWSHVLACCRQVLKEWG